MAEPCDLETSVADWVIEHPQAAALMDRLGIDYACGGRSLEWACQRTGLDPQTILRQLERELGLHRDQPASDLFTRRASDGE